MRPIHHPELRIVQEYAIVVGLDRRHRDVIRQLEGQGDARGRQWNGDSDAGHARAPFGRDDANFSHATITHVKHFASGSFLHANWNETTFGIEAEEFHAYILSATAAGDQSEGERGKAD